MPSRASSTRCRAVILWSFAGAACSPAPEPAAPTSPSIAAVVGAPSSSAPSRTATAVADVPAPPDSELVKRLRTGDGISVNELASICRTSSAAELARVVPSLSSFGKQRAAMCLELLPGGGPVLLRLFEEPDLMVRASAARGLQKVSDPSIADGLLRALAQPNEGVQRAKLYLALGRSLPAGRIEELRALAQKEPKTEAFTSGDPSKVALFALAKLGGAPERQALFAAVQAVKHARGDDPHAVTELLVDYLQDRAFAKALTPWLADQTNVDSSHQASYRACDLAVLTAKRLGVDVGVDAAGIKKYDGATLARARAQLDAMPAP